MSGLKNDLILRAAKGEKIERVPVWLMRQAGRILPQYREIRSSLSGFKELVETPELAAKVTIQPVDELGVDAAIIFSDILVIPESMGLSYHIQESVGPVFEKTIDSRADIDRLKVSNPHEDLHYVLEAIKHTKQEMNGRVPLIGFAGAPWTIFCYMLEGKGSKTFSKARRVLYNNTEDAEALLEMITESTIAYLKAQVEAGADIIQVFDSWAGILPPAHYKQFSLKYIERICNSINDVPVIVFAKGAWFAMDSIAKLNCEVIGLDWNMEAKSIRSITADSKTLQGNLDPCLLYADTDSIKNATNKMLNGFGGQRHIANLGHGVYPDTPLDGVKCFVDTVKEFNYTPA